VTTDSPLQPPTDPTSRAWLAPALVGAVLLWAYWPALFGQWTWDDDVHVTANTLLRDGRGLEMIWTRLGATPQYYPLTHTSFWLEFRVFGLNPVGYHVVSLLMHAGASLILWRILKSLGLRAAGLIACVWALHPVQVETVAWVSERKNTLSTLLYLGAAACFLRSQFYQSEPSKRPPSAGRWYAASFALFVCAVASKTVAGSLPAALLVVLWWKRSLSRRAVLTTLPMFVVSVCLGSVTAHMEREIVGARGADWDFSFVERVLIASRAIMHYVQTIIWPADLCFIYAKWPTDPTLLLPWLWVGSVVALTLIGVVVAARGGRGMLAGWLFFCGTIFPALGFVNVYPMRYSFAADHFQYLAGVGVIVLVVEGAWRAASARKLIGPLVVALTLASGALCVITRVHAGTFRTPTTLWQATLKTNPAAWIALDHLAAIALEQGDLDSAEAYYRRAIEIHDTHHEAHTGLADVLRRQNRPTEALASLRTAVDVGPLALLPRHLLATEYLRQNQPAEAAAEFERVLQIDARFEPSRLQLAQLEWRNGHPDRAAALYQAGVIAFPESVQCRVQWADLLMVQGQPETALPLYEQAQRLQPGSKPIAERINRAKQATGR